MKLSVDFLKQYSAKPMESFIETGTGLGCALEVACSLFTECESTDIRDDRIDFNYKKFAAANNVILHKLDSVKFLKIRCCPVESTTFFLDAHYGGDGLAPDIECPLLEELRTIIAVSWQKKPVIIIDDAAYFFNDFWKTPKAKPYTRSKWPTFKQIMDIVEPHDFNCEIFKVRGKPKVLILR